MVTKSKRSSQPAIEWGIRDPSLYFCNIVCYICGHYIRYRQSTTNKSQVKHGKDPHSKEPSWTEEYRLIIKKSHSRRAYLSDVKTAHVSPQRTFPSNALHMFKKVILWETIKRRAEYLRLKARITSLSYGVHSCCWELLKTHKLRTLAETDLVALLAAIFKYPPMPPISHACEDADPYFTATVFDAIYSEIGQAELRRKQGVQGENKRPALKPSKETGICGVPLELVYMIAKYLPVQDASSLEKALDLRLGSVFWRSKISFKLYYEMRAITREDIDWGSLCTKLQGYESSDALRARQAILRNLDEIWKNHKKNKEGSK
ncbi:uncharacterized protein BO97DRAFT_419392 [Aspergillus homomorphus CBS 101889]|uniref:Uncharacterized protein n=1 Tax=Aspergillus homomorphus (strain CBS 101889) TaxID=1450537 RepID=A0A395IDA8_ASPHC|nr:hypothetical protein BO97DRAFT_419392 [Aspergillus homomorphus CBS 101889]RAL17143.1 hypothetical protein BO97DRAFT_419392 [Aspergillus homomorphus CBS 101889]